MRTSGCRGAILQKRKFNTWLGVTLSSHSAGGYLKIAQGQLQAAVFGMIVVADGKGDIDGVAGQERGLLHTLGHMPAQGVEGDLTAKISSEFAVFSSQFTAACIGFG